MKKRLLILSMLPVIVTSIACSVLPESEGQKYVKSEIKPFSSSAFNDFQDYLEQTSANITQYKLYMNESNKAVELATSFPYQIKPSQCGELTQGIVLVHGLSDTPFAMRDLANEFAKRCFLVRNIILPAHGTRAGDMLDVTNQEWRDAVQFAINTLRADVSAVYVGGFSLGGLLAIDNAIENSDIKAAFAFSPALALPNPTLVKQTVWLRYMTDWLDTGEQDDYARYEAMPINGVAETYLLGESVQDKLIHQNLTTPIFLVQSSDDATIDSRANRELFSRYLTNPNSRLISYNSQTLNSKDKRITDVNVVNPLGRIASYSHQSVHISPDNAHYGKQGSYRNCGVNSTNRTPEQLSECLYGENIWRGEIISYPDDSPFNPNTMARLTYNPQFSQMMTKIDEFLSRI